MNDEQQLVEDMSRAIEQAFVADPLCGGRFCSGTAEAAATAALSILKPTVKAMEEALRTSERAIQAAFAQADAEERDHMETASRYAETIDNWRAIRDAALNGGSSNAR